jgi:predicted lipid-binding transport protein (Tim44 family)
MKVWSALLAVIVTATTAFVSVDAHAKRLGGGQSVGKQSSNVTKREAAPAQPTPATPAQANPAAPTPQPAAAAAQKKPWGAMLGGLAAGLGLAWLAHSLGFGEGLAQFLMFMLLALAVMVVVGLVLRKLRSGRQGAATSPFAMQGAGAPSVPQYSPSHVGNDASARPWERQNAHFDASAPAATSGSMIGSALTGPQSSWGVPTDFDVAGFLGAAKANFVSLQGAWDRSDIPALRAMMTDEMLSQIQAQLAERESHTGGASNLTEVLSLDAKLLGIEELEDVYMASVEFSGMIREDQSAGPSPFREVWNMTKPRHRSGGWLVAGVQALQ